MTETPNPPNALTAPHAEALRITRGALIGHAVGDALGVPVEFASRKARQEDPVRDMRGFGTHNQPAGTWSDDASLTLCTAQSLIDGYDLVDMGKRFTRWMLEAYWTPHGQVFDIGQTTREAIFRLDKGTPPTEAGPVSEYSNGNGSLMRMIPIGLYFAQTPVEKRLRVAMESSQLTHGHARSQLACAFYVDLVARLVQRVPYQDALQQTQQILETWIDANHPEEMEAFAPCLDNRLADRPADSISGSGYVLDTLSASLWCCLRTDCYEQAVLTAVNLGDDTDTTGAVTGGLAGLIYGMESIPRHWREQLARIGEIEVLCDLFANACVKQWEQES